MTVFVPHVDGVLFRSCLTLTLDPPSSRPALVARGLTLYLPSSRPALVARAENMMVVAGEHFLGSTEGTEQYFKPRRLVPHPSYDQLTKHADIMLIKVQERRGERRGLVLIHQHPAAPYSRWPDPSQTSRLLVVGGLPPGAKTISEVLLSLSSQQFSNMKKTVFYTFTHPTITSCSCSLRTPDKLYILLEMNKDPKCV